MALVTVEKLIGLIVLVLVLHTFIYAHYQSLDTTAIISSFNSRRRHQSNELIFNNNNSHNQNNTQINNNQQNINFRQYGNGLIFGPIFWNHLPNHTQEEFLHYFPMNAIVNIDETWNGELNLHNVAPLYHKYISIIPQTKQIVWHTHGILVMIKCVELRLKCEQISNLSNYKNAALQLYSIFDDINISSNNNKVLVGGSISPWVESIVLGLNISKYVTTTDYQLPLTNYQYIKTVNIMDIKNNNNKYKYNIIISYSSIEHDGLGRYGDPLNPWGDFAALMEFYNMLQCNDNSYLILNVPFGSNGILYFNQHRQYGAIRIQQLINQTGFKFIGYTLQDRPMEYIVFADSNALSQNVAYFVDDYKKTNHRTRGDNTLVLKPVCN
eukprot:169637_1